VTQGGLSRRAGLALVCVAVIAGFVAWSWPLGRHLSTHTLILEAELTKDEDARAGAADWDLIVANDQNLSLWGAADNARSLLRGNWTGLMWQGQCYPMPEATTLGEHMIELGVLASPWLLLSGDPVVAYNLSFLGALVIGAAGMFLFLHRHTASTAAAAVGAIAFAFATPRLVDLPYHPAVVGTHWLPWVLWSFDRALDGEPFGALGGERPGALGGERLRALLWFAVTLLLSALVGSYPLLAVSLVGGAYGVATVVQRWRRGALQPAALALCVAAALPAIAIAVVMLRAYVRIQSEWVLMPNAGAKFVVAATDFLPGGLMSAGTVALAGLVPLCVLRRGSGRDAVPGLAAAALVTFLLATALTMPGGASWSVYELLARHVALFDSVRAPGKVGLAVCFALQALGAIGWSRLFGKLPVRARAPGAALLVAVTLLEVSPPSWARAVLGTGAAMKLRVVAPPRTTIEAMEASLGDPRDLRPVLDLPTGRMVKAPLALVDAAYHGHATSACYNSMTPPTMRAVYALGERRHSARGVAELAAAGFGFVIERPTSAPLSPTSMPAPARLLVFEKDMAVWGLPHAAAVHSEIAKLAFEVVGGATRGDTFAPEPPHELDVLVTNRGDDTWVAPRPLEPLFADVELASADGTVVFRSRARGVLPLALAPQGWTRIQLVMPDAPAPGAWRASIHIGGAPHATTVPGFSWVDERG